jgi:hypothetical protein
VAIALIGLCEGRFVQRSCQRLGARAAQNGIPYDPNAFWGYRDAQKGYQRGYEQGHPPKYLWQRPQLASAQEQRLYEQLRSAKRSPFLDAFGHLRRRTPCGAILPVKGAACNVVEEKDRAGTLTQTHTKQDLRNATRPAHKGVDMEEYRKPTDSAGVLDWWRRTFGEIRCQLFCPWDRFVHGNSDALGGHRRGAHTVYRAMSGLSEESREGARKEVSAGRPRT